MRRQKFFKRRNVSVMKMADHIRRFSMPPPGFVATNQAATGMAAQPVAKMTLAQIYALAQQRAVEAVHRRQWNSLVRRLFDR
jgi:hypothetical protein